MIGISQFIRVGLCVGALMAGTGGTSRANELVEVEVTRLDGTTEAGALVAFAAQALELRTAEETHNVPRADVARIRFFPSASESDADGNWVMELTDTSRFHGTVLEGEADSLHAQTRFAGRYDLAFDRLHTVRRAREPATVKTLELYESARANALPGSDVLITQGQGQGRGQEAKAVRGTLLEFGSKRCAFLFNGKRRSLATEKVYGVVMAAATSSTAPPPARVFLAGADGDVLAGAVETINNQGLALRDGGGNSRRVSLSSVRAIEFTSHRVVYLSDLAPTSFASFGVVHANRSFRRDRNVACQPLRLRGHAHDKGLGVRAHSALIFELREAYKTFAAEVGVDDAVRLGGSVEFRVLADGKQVFSSGIVRGGDEIQHVRVPLEGVKRLTLVVDFADNADVGDWADWANARLIKPRDETREVY